MAISDTCVDETPECDIVVDDRLFALELLALEDVESHLHVAQLSIRFDKDAHLDRHIVVMLVSLLRVDLELCELKLNLLVIKNGRELLLGASFIVNLNGLVSERVPYTKVHERVQNYDIQMLVEFVHQVPEVGSYL